MIYKNGHQGRRNSALSPASHDFLKRYSSSGGLCTQSDLDSRERGPEARRCSSHSWDAKAVPDGSHGNSRERGSGTIMILGLLVAFALAIMGVMAIGDVVATQEHSQHAADVAALAGAEELRRSGPSAACSTAGEVALRNYGTVRDCDVVDEHVVVVIRAKAAMTGYSVESRARAGPADRPP